jgi:iron complex outermembrane recepter protein
MLGIVPAEFASPDKMKRRPNNGKMMVLADLQNVIQWMLCLSGKRQRPAFLALLVMIFLPTVIYGSTTTNLDLSEVPLEQLLNMDVTILRGHDMLSKTPAAISVVTADDIRRSGAMSIPEALRQVPGMDVARIDPSEWAVSARGFNDQFANKLLVLQDGRTVYSPLFSGVFWDVPGTMMDDIDRIEVIRGPGSTVWGANAVNGVINIITKDAKDTQGWLASAGAGNIHQGFVNARYGGQLGSNVFYRVYGTYLNDDSFPLPNGREANDAWRMGRSGFHLDWYADNGNLFTLQGDGYMGWVHETFMAFDMTSPTFTREVPTTMDVRGGNVLGRWTHTFSDTSEVRGQLYYDRTERDATIFAERRDTIDLDVQHNFSAGTRNEFTWGFGYRYTSGKIDGSPTVVFVPASDNLNLFSGFGQDEVTIVPDRVKLTLGTKIEHTEFSGWELEPGGRLAWTPDDRNTLWVSVARAVRTPTLAEENSHYNQPEQTPFGPVVLQISGNRNFESEKLMAYEAGYRIHPCDKASLDLAGFFNVYSDLRSVEVGAPTFPFIPATLANGLYGNTYGVEAAATIEAASWWRLNPSYTLLKMDLHAKHNSTDTTSVAQEEGASPQQQFSLHSGMDLAHNITLDATLRYVDSLPSLRVESYVTMDARVAWRATKNLELALVGQDLFTPTHAEFRPTQVQNQPANVPRSFYAKVTWRF